MQMTGKPVARNQCQSEREAKETLLCAFNRVMSPEPLGDFEIEERECGMDLDLDLSCDSYALRRTQQEKQVK